MDAPTYTRREVSSSVGVEDDVLSFWLKRRLLVPISGGDGRGNHRKFDALQGRIAAILKAMRDVGTNISVMTRLADKIQSTAEFGRSIPVAVDHVRRLSLSRGSGQFEDSELCFAMRRGELTECEATRYFSLILALSSRDADKLDLWSDLCSCVSPKDEGQWFWFLDQSEPDTTDLVRGYEPPASLRHQPVTVAINLAVIFSPFPVIT
ncbi:MerR family transcriptional regulator [Sphingomonas natans]|uniref:MerR family transcriptional regulator n=1 Tax=Sphingomonas natans TaxID=3063330 RepID=UPI0026E37CF5|nr:MerR family transcriptional regulator [Sphingomonas sp. BIUV-7]